MKHCENCGKQFNHLIDQNGNPTVESRGIERKTCSRDCRYALLASQLNGRKVPFDELKNTATKRRRLLAERGWRCESCGFEEWCGEPIPLTMDHIDGNPDNGLLSNCRLLCWSCHALTPTFGAKNIGKNRQSRRYRWRQRYRGKI